MKYLAELAVFIFKFIPNRATIKLVVKSVDRNDPLTPCLLLCSLNSTLELGEKRLFEGCFMFPFTVFIFQLTYLGIV